MSRPWNKRQILFIGMTLILFSFVLFRFDGLTGAIQSVANVLSPLIIGAILAYAINIPIDFLERRLLRFLDKKPWSKKIKRPLAFLLVIGLFAALLTILLTEIIPQIVQLVNVAILRLPALLQSLNAFLKEQGIHVSSMLLDQFMPDAANPSKIENLLNSAGQILLHGVIGSGLVLGSVFSSVLGTFFTMMFIIYGIMGKEKLVLQSRKLLYAYAPERRAHQIKELLHRANKVFRSFIANQFLEALILGLLLFLSMSLFAMPYALLISVLTAMFAIIPIIGGWIAAIAGALLIATQRIEMSLYFILLFLVVQTIEGNVIYPKVMGSAIGLPGLWVLVAVVIGQSFFGVFGSLLLIPLSSLCYALLREHSHKKIMEKDIAQEHWNQLP